MTEEGTRPPGLSPAHPKHAHILGSLMAIEQMQYSQGMSSRQSTASPLGGSQGPEWKQECLARPPSLSGLGRT